MIWVLLAACGTRWAGEGVELSVHVHSDRVHQADLSIELDDPSPVAVTCVAEDDDDEVHGVQGAVSASHELALQGLLADTTYLCELEAGTAALSFEHTSGALSPETPDWTVTGDPEASDGAWTLFNHGENGHHADREQLVVVDAQGRARWSYPLPPGSAADIDATVVDGRVLYGGSGYGGRPTEVALNWERSWLAPGELDEEHYHHHVQDVPGLGVLTLVKTEDEVAGVTFEGFAVEVLDRETNDLAWRWSSQEAIDAGELPGGRDIDDPFHANQAEWIEDDQGTALLLSLRTINRVLRVDVETGEVIWTLGPNGDITLVDEEGLALGNEDWFYSQHAPELAGNRLLVYDNGIGRPGEDRSQVVEFGLDVEGGTLTKLWAWEEPDFLESIWGDADRTPGGEHVLIARGHCFNCPDAIAGTHSALVEVDTATGEEVWRLQFEQEEDALYRAERLEGCALFTQVTACEQQGTRR